MNVRYVVDLTEDERNELRSTIQGGSGKVRRIKRAQMLLAADAGATDEEMARDIGVGTSTLRDPLKKAA